MELNGYPIYAYSFYALPLFSRHAVIRVHPRNDRLFVEAVNAWGRDSQIKVEPRLLPMVS